MSATSAILHPKKIHDLTHRGVLNEFLRSCFGLFGALALLGVGFAFALIFVHGRWVTGPEPTLSDRFDPFVLMFVIALALERIIQPIAPWLGPDTAVAKVDLAKAQQDATKTDADVLTAKALVGNARSMTALLTWGVATGLACVLAASIKLTLLRTLIVGGGLPPYWIDLLLTGLIIGAGTKPLNDLWSRLQG